MGDVTDYMRIAAELVRDAPSVENTACLMREASRLLRQMGDRAEAGRVMSVDPDRYVGVVEMLARADAQVAAGKQLADACRAIVIRCEEGDRRTNWLPTIRDLAAAALAEWDKLAK